MLVLRNNQITIWEQILPKELQVLPEELQRIDELLDDDRFFKPYIERFNTRTGRPTSGRTHDTFIRRIQEGSTLHEACFSSIYSNMRDNLYIYLSSYS